MTTNRSKAHQVLPAATLLALVTTLSAWAWRNRFIQDDAFISFRYADNLRRGLGLVWNVGERVEGFTNFLWVLIMAAAMRAGAEPILASQRVGLLCFVGTLVFTWLLTRRLGGGAWLAAAAVLMTGTNFTFSAYATGGLETQSHALVFTAAAYLLCRCLDPDARRHDLAALSFALAAAMYTRLDSGPLVAVFGLTALAATARRASTWRAFGGSLAALAGPFVLLMGALAAFKLAWFGDLLPNTFYAKATAHGMSDRGRRYVVAFIESYALHPLVVVFASGFARAAWERVGRALALYAVIAMWVLYVVKVGGDFMEYRLLVPILPIFFATVAWVFHGIAGRPEVPAALVAWTVWSSVHYGEYSRTLGDLPNGLGVETVHGLASHVEEAPQAWGDIGIALGNHFDHDPTVTLSVVAAGAVCYYSRLRSIDMAGLSDRWIARHGLVVSERPGHQRMAPIDYLLAREVNLVVHPWMVGDIEESISSYSLANVARYLPGSDVTRLPMGASIIEVPVRPGRSVRVLYMQRHPVIDAAIARGQWRVFAIFRGA